MASRLETMVDEAARLCSLVSPENVTELYHYTTAEALHSILSGKQLFISDSQFMNDKFEASYAKNLFEELAKDRISGKTLSDLLELADSGLLKTFVLSLTKDRDALAMWYYFAAFSTSDTSFCIQFDLSGIAGNLKSVINSLIEKPTASAASARPRKLTVPLIANVCYSLKQQKSLLLNVIDYYNKWYEQYPEYVKSVMSSILPVLLACIKKPGFRIEKEVRLVIPIEDENDLAKYMRTRVSKGIVIPYIIMDLKNFVPFPIKQITVLYKNNFEDIKNGLDNMIKYDIHEKDITIIRSAYELRY